MGKTFRLINVRLTFIRHPRVLWFPYYTSMLTYKNFHFLEQENGQPPEPELQCLELDTAMPGNDLDNGRGRIKDVASWIQCGK